MSHFNEMHFTQRRWNTSTEYSQGIQSRRATKTEQNKPSEIQLPRLTTHTFNSCLDWFITMWFVIKENQWPAFVLTEERINEEKTEFCHLMTYKIKTCPTGLNCSLHWIHEVVINRVRAFVHSFKQNWP